MKYIKHIVLTIFVIVMTAVSANAMQIFVHFANGTWPTSVADYHFNSSGDLIIEIESNGSIGEAKDKIGDKTGLVASDITLSFGNYADLDDSYTLAYYNITSELTINMTYPDPTQPQRVTNNNWRVQTMPRGDRVLRTIWKQDAGLAYAKADTTVYRGFTSTVQNPLTNPHDLTVTYSITHDAGTNSSGNTISNDGTVTINGAGIDTVKARFAGNNDYLPDSAMYILRTLEPYKLTLVANGNGTVGIDGDLPDGVIEDTATYDDDNLHYLVHPVLAGDIDLVASPNPLNYFVSWTNALESDDDSLKAAVTLISDTTVAANFAPYPTLTVTTTGSGSVSVASEIGNVETPLPADANTTNVYTLAPGTAVKLTATPDDHNHFVSWTNATASANNPLTATLQVTENVTVTAAFAGDAYLTIASNNTAYGNVAFVMASSEQKAHEKAVASTEYVPTPTGVDLYENCNQDDTKWYYDNDGIDASLGYMINKSNGPEVSRVVFTLTNNETHTVTASTGSNSNAYFYYVYPKYNNVYSDANYTNLVCSSCGITKVELYVGDPSNPEGVDIVDATHAYVKPGKSVDVKATPNAAYYFVKWNDEEAINSNTAVTTSYTAPANGTYEAASLTANFALKTYTVTVTSSPTSPHVYGTAAIIEGANSDGSVNHGATITIKATPTTGHHFAAWEGDINSDDNPHVIVGVDRDYIINAYFEVNTYSVTASGEHGTVALSGEGLTTDGHHGKYGGTVTFTAIPDAGYRFVHWNDGKTVNPLDSTILSAVHLTATFELANPGLTPEGEVTVQGNRFVDEHGQIVGSPRLTEHGEFIDNGNSTSPVSLIGKFSVSSTKKVYFSPANLQYTRTSTSVDWSTGTWSFMPHQYSIVETAANPYCTQNYGDKTAVGLFGWGTWGQDKTPNLTSTSNSDYSWTDFSGPLGGYNDWRTLTKDEWIYLLSTRATGVTVNDTNNARYTLATINTGTAEVKGMIVFPDGFTCSNTEGVTWDIINAKSNYTTTCTADGWNALEAANCLFLPATGWRAKNLDNGDGVRVEGINSWGYYWTSNPWENSTYEGCDIVFDNDKVKSDDHAQRRFGFSVRLVRDAE
jgi:hypothetical protein